MCHFDYPLKNVSLGYFSCIWHNRYFMYIITSWAFLKCISMIIFNALNSCLLSFSNGFVQSFGYLFVDQIIACYSYSCTVFLLKLLESVRDHLSLQQSFKITLYISFWQNKFFWKMFPFVLKGLLLNTSFSMFMASCLFNYLDEMSPL